MAEHLILNVDAIIGAQITFLVKKGETFQYAFPIKDRQGNDVPLPANITITASKNGEENFVMATGNGLTVTGSVISIRKQQNLNRGTWTLDSTITLANGIIFKLFGSMIVQ